MSGRRPTIGQRRICSQFRASLRNRLSRSSRQNFRPNKKPRSKNVPLRIWSRLSFIFRRNKSSIAISLRRTCEPRCCKRWNCCNRRSNAMRTLSQRIVMPRAQTICSTSFDLDPTPDRILLAETAVNTALRLRPDSAEAHFAKGDFLFRCRRDYDAALAELEIARPGLPNNTPFFLLSGYINRRRNHWDIAEREFATAVAHDPRNPNAYNLLADTFVLQRQFPRAVEIYERVRAAGEDTPIARFRQASAIYWGTGNSKPLRDSLAESPTMDIAGGQTPVRVLFALIDGDRAEAERVLATSPRADFQDIDFSFYYPKAWFEAMIARDNNDEVRAQAAFRTARADPSAAIGHQTGARADDRGPSSSRRGAGPERTGSARSTARY